MLSGVVCGFHGCDKLEAMMTRNHLPMPRNQAGYTGDIDYVKRNLDCAVINYLHLLQKKLGEPDYDTIRGVFVEGEPLYTGAKIQGKTHIQICVRNTKFIKGYFAPIPGQKY